MIRVVLSRPKKFDIVSFLIRKATNFPASHASIHIDGSGTLSGRTIVLEATGSGVGIVPGGWWHAKNKVVRAYKFAGDQNVGAEAFRQIWDASNVPYDFLGIFWFALRLITRWIFGVNVSYASDSPQRLFCSELVARWLVALSELSLREGEVALSISPEDTAPGDLVPIIESMGMFEKTTCPPLSSVTSISEHREDSHKQIKS